MKKYTPINGNRLVKSRGTKDQSDSLIAVPEDCLVDSSVCTDEQTGAIVIIKDSAGTDIGNHRRIVDGSDILAEVVDGRVLPAEEWFVGRKCEDPVDPFGIIISLSTRKNQFVEIIKVGAKTNLNEFEECLAHIDNLKYNPQKIEETDDDWLIKKEAVQFIYIPEE